MYWKSLTRSEINQRVEAALNKNASYAKGDVMGTPATYLDEDEFYPDASFLKDAPYLRTLIANPNHIGCHTLRKQSSPIFKGTQAIERELIKLCAEEVFQSPRDGVDGYITTGGTEANIEAMWIYRNYFKKEYGATNDQIGLIYSEDAHYSIPKGGDLLQLESIVMPVNINSRAIKMECFEENLANAKKRGLKYFIIILNVSTTMFGSVDEIEPIVELMDRDKSVFKLHLDAAFGGFIYPFTHPNSVHNFNNPRVSSISIDAHKMLQTPYGTGIFLIRKGYMHYVTNEQAQYVPGLDYTLCGSRSGANAIVIWMLLMVYGSEGWNQKMVDIIKRTDYVCERLDKMGVKYFRNPHINIVTIKANNIPNEIAKKYELVADTYEHMPTWWKIVVMDHVKYDLLKRFLDELEGKLAIG